MKEKETGKMKNQNNTAQSAGKKSFLQKKNVEISFKRYAIDAMGAMALGLFASLLIGTIIKTLAENVGTTGMMAALAAITAPGALAAHFFCFFILFCVCCTSIGSVFFLCSLSGNEYIWRLRWAIGCIICSDYCLRGRKTCL